MDNNYYFSMGAAQGWQCPICHRVLSPWTQECPCKGKVEWETVTTAMAAVTEYEEYTMGEEDNA